jgi:hypothetical protein
MSRIFDALKNVQEARTKTGEWADKLLGMMEPLDRRESPRVEINVELTVYGRTAGGPPFYEAAMAVKGNANGGLLLMTIPVVEGQDLLLINNRISREQLCRVAEFRVRDSQTCEVSVIFPAANPDFWKISGTAE